MPKDKGDESHALHQELERLRRENQDLRQSLDTAQTSGCAKDLLRSEERFRLLAEEMPVLIHAHDKDGLYVYWNKACERTLGYTREEMLGNPRAAEMLYPDPEVRARLKRARLDPSGYRQAEAPTRAKDGSTRLILWTDASKGTALPGWGRWEIGRDITEQKADQEALEKRLNALTRPMDDTDGVDFEDLFDLEDIQRLQDLFSRSFNVSSIITRPDGTPLTRPSNFTRFCKDVVRGTEQGRAKCFHSDQILGRPNPDGPTIMPCLSAGLWNAGASITVGGYHVANWLMGQMRDETLSEEQVRAYVREIGADEDAAVEALAEVPSIPMERYRAMAETLHAMAAQLSRMAYQSLLQARFITESRQAQAALKKSELRFRSVIETAPLGFATADMEGKLLQCNKALADILRTTPEALIGINFGSFTHPEDLEREWELAKGLLRGETEAYRMEKRYLRHDGSQAWVNICTSLLRDEAGEPSMFFAFVQDISEKHAQDLALAKAKELAEAASKTKSVFLADMSHEIRTPMHGVLGMLELLSDTRLDNDQAKYVQVARAAGQALLRVISDILDLSRVEAGRLELYPEPLDLAVAVGSVSDALGRRIQEKELDLVLDLDPSLPESVMADAARIHQILFNLLGNSVKFTQVGEIRMSLSRLHHPDPDLVRLYVEVADTGVGIPDDRMAKIAKPFSQADDSPARRQQGSGLGLTIVRKLLELMDGTLTMVSEAGKGTTTAFSVTLPLAKADRRSERRQTRSPGRSLRLLVAEDDRTNQLAMDRFLTKLGHEVIMTETGEQALDMIKRETVDAVLLDIRMPLMSGEEVARRVRGGEAGEDKRGMWLVAVTAHAMRGDRERFLEAGMNDYLPKPVDMAELKRVLGEIPERNS